MDLGGRTRFADDETLFPGLLKQHDPIVDYVGTFIEEEGLKDDFTELTQCFRADDMTWRGFYALDRVSFVRRNPLHGIKVAETNVQPFAEMAQKHCFNDLIPAMATLVDVDTGDVPAIQVPSMKTPESVLDFCESVFRAAMVERDKAFAAYSREELAFVYSNAPAFLNKLVDHMYLSVPYFKDRNLQDEYYATWDRVANAQAAIRKSADGKGDQALQEKVKEALRDWNDFIEEHKDDLEQDNQFYERNCRLLKLTEKTDYPALVRMSQIMAVFLREDVQLVIKGAIENADRNQRQREDETADRAQRVTGERRGTPIRQEIILGRKTPYGEMVIGGRGDNIYSNDFAVIIDPDGNDVAGYPLDASDPHG